jgi:hypothetical protein
VLFPGAAFWFSAARFCDALLRRFFLGAFFGWGFGDFAFFAVVFDGAPHVPAGDAAVGAPAFAKLGEFARLGDERLVVGERETFLHPVVVNREHVRAPETENQKHFDGPGADAFYGNEARDEFFVGERAGGFESRDDAVDGFLREVVHRGGFGVRESGFAKSLNGCGENFVRRGALAVCAERFDTRENFGSGFAANALMDDGFEERFVDRVAGVEREFEFAVFGDEAGEALVFRGEVRVGGDVVVGEFEFGGHGVGTRRQFSS